MNPCSKTNWDGLEREEIDLGTGIEESGTVVHMISTLDRELTFDFEQYAVRVFRVSGVGGAHRVTRLGGPY